MEESAEELYEDAPCGYMSSLLDGTIVRVNRTFLRWTGLERDAVVGRRIESVFSPASRLFFEVHAAPQLLIDGEIHGIALEVEGAQGGTFPVMVDAALKRDDAGEPRLVRTTFFDATERTAHERELLEARRGEQAARERMALLADVGRGLDEVRTLAQRAQRLAELLVPHAASGVWVDLGDARTEEPEAMAVRDSDAVEPLLGARRRLPLPATAPEIHGDVALLPLRVRDHVIGVLGMAGVPPALAGDRAFLADLAARAATALENARLYDHERSVAHALQHSLLATDLPTDPRLALVPRYRSGVASLEVGGDWYDAFELAPGRIGICVGDVVARGLEAATTMGQLRTALRALAAAELGPAGVLSRLDAFAEQVPRGRMATVAYAELNLDDGRLRYVCGGHPPPLLVDPDGRAQLLMEGRSAPLGAATGARPEAEVLLTPGARLLFYTDGLVDRRGRSLERGLALLVEAAGRRTATPARLADGVLEALLGDDPQDDVCVLAVGFGAGTRFDRELGARPEELAPLRDDLRAWLSGNAVVGHDRDALVFAASEAVTNAIEHAYRDVAAGLVWVSARMGSDGVLLRVTDHGSWRPPGEVEDRGRGLLLLDKLMDVVEVDHEAGTTVTMRKHVAGPE